MPRLFEKRELESALKTSGISDAAAFRIRTRLNESTVQPPSRDAASDGRYSYTGRSILTAVGLFFLLTSVMIVARSFIGSLSGLLVAGVAFTLSSYFHQRGEGMPMVVLLAGTVFGIADTLLGLIASLDSDVAAGSQFEAGHSAIVFGGAAIAAVASWTFYRLPLAFATFLVMILITGGGIVDVFVKAPSTWGIVIWPSVFAIFTLALACWHDISDVYRETLRSDVAFWLHVMGGILIAAQFFLLYEFFAHPAPLIATSPEQITMISPAASGIAIAIFLAYIAYAILLDRLCMALIGSSFIMCAMHSALGLDLYAISMMITGVSALTLAAMWQSLRQNALKVLPPIVRAQLPRTFSRADGKRPVQ